MTAASTAYADDAASGGYSARHLSVLEGLDAVRKRPGMYIGSTDSRGLMHCLWEIVDNAVDEALGGHCDRVEVTLHSDGSLEVRDNGRGIPVDTEPKTGLSGVELVMTKLHAGGKFGGGSYATSGGLHGVGASVVNALSSRLDVEVDRGGRTHAISFRRGIPGVFEGEGPTAAFKRGSGLREVKRVAKRVTGCRVRFWPDLQIFLPDATVLFDKIVDRVRQTAFLVPGLTLALRDERPREGAEGPYEEEFRFDGGISEFCTYLAPDEPIGDIVRLEGSGHFTETVPVLDDEGHMTSTEVERELTVDIALRWGTGYDSVVRSFVNVVATPKGGTHVSGFERALVRALNEQLRGAKLLRNGDDSITKEDAQEGLTAVVAVRVPEPQFEGQTKEVLGTSAASRIVAKVVGQGLTQYFENPKRGQKQQARATLEKIAAAAKARVAAREHRENQRRKSALENSALPAKLVDCRSEGERSELFIVEGDSALGTAKLARNSEFQALLPIRGKILNVQKASLADMLKNTECASIIQVLGAGSGRTFDIDGTRYERLILMSVAGDEPVLVTSPDGHLSLRKIGPWVDHWLDSGIDVPDASTITLDQGAGRPSTAQLKKVIRHRYRGVVRKVRTAYGREASVTAGHSLFTYDEGRISLRPADTLREGDLIVAPRSLPRPSQPMVELDLAKILRDADEHQAVRVEGESVRAVQLDRAVNAVGPQADDRRVAAPAHVWRKLAARRRALGMTQREMATHLGFRQAGSICGWEKGHGRPPESAFRGYLEVVEMTWPQEATLVPSLREKWRDASDASGNAHYRKTARTAWLGELSESEFAELGRDIVLYARAHRDRRVSRFMPITEELCEFLGWYAAEGSHDPHGQVKLSLGDGDDALIHHLTEIVGRVFGVPAKIARERPGSRRRTLYFHAPLVARLVRALGLGGHAPDKRLPDFLLNVDESCQLAFLAGLYLGDGTKGRQSKRLTIVSTSRELASGVGYLLGQLSVIASTSKIETDSNPLSLRPYYSVTVCGADQIRRLRRVWRDAANAELIRGSLAESHFTTGHSKAVPVSDSLVALPITSIVDTTVDDDVYDFSVADDESFVVGFGGGLMAHNTDADVDGAHIRTLLLTLLYRYMNPLLEAGRVYAAVPPLHRIELTKPRKGQDRYMYTYSDAELGRKLAELERKGQRWKEPVQRYKGLGEMDADQLAETTMDPRRRTLRRIRIEDAEEAASVFDLLMGNVVAPRREFIINGAAVLDPDKIDL